MASTEYDMGNSRKERNELLPTLKRFVDSFAHCRFLVFTQTSLGKVRFNFLFYLSQVEEYHDFISISIIGISYGSDFTTFSTELSERESLGAFKKMNLFDLFMISMQQLFGTSFSNCLSLEKYKQLTLLI